MDRRGFLARLGLASATLAVGRVSLRAPVVAEARPPNAEALEIRVYGGAGPSDRRLLLAQPIPTLWESAEGGGVAFYGPPDLDLVLDGPIWVTAVALQTPARLRWVRDEAVLPCEPGCAQRRGERVIIVLPTKLMTLQ